MPLAYSLLLSRPPPYYDSSKSKSLCLAPPSYSRPLRISTVSFPAQLRCRRRSAVRSTVEPNKDEQRVKSDVGTLLRRLWKAAAPYWSSDDKIQARLRLAAVFALTLATTGIHVVFNFLGRDFFNALASKNQRQFMKQLLYYLGAFAGGIPVFVLKNYARKTLSLRWRSWMTGYYMERYMKNQAFYKIQSQSIIDNPDQRIVDDLESFTSRALSFSLTLLNAVADLISFSNILYRIYPLLFVVLLVYSIGGTAVSVVLGKDLVTLNFMQEKKEADFRYGLVRIRENAESIAFYGGEGNELQLLLERFRGAFENLSKLLISSRNLDFFTIAYSCLIQILPAAVVAPMYFSGKIEMGVINQSISAFNHILHDCSLIVNEFQAISAFSAVIDRLGEFDDVVDGTNDSYNSISDAEKDITILCSKRHVPPFLHSNGSMPLDGCHKLLEIQHLTLHEPSNDNILIMDLSLDVNDKDHLLVTGPSGSGKTSLLRGLAGLWSTGKGDITYYIGEVGLPQISMTSDTTPESMNASQFEEFKEFKRKRTRDIFFLPQKPYMVLGSLRQQLLYPTWFEDSLSCSDNIKYAGSLPFLSQGSSSEDYSDKPKKPTVDDMIHVLEIVRLGDILSRFNGLDSMYEWSSVLSLGEQQRLAFARLLLSKSKLALLDESTSALDVGNEAHLYKQIEAAGITYISIGHRRTLYDYHKKVLHISLFNPGKPSQRNWHLELINQRTINEGPKPAL